MNELQKIIKEQIELREKEFPESDKKEHWVKFIGAKYFTVHKNGDIHHSENDEILEPNNIEFVIVFPKIRYKPQKVSNESYLKAITINSEMEAFNGELYYNDWTIHFYDQYLKWQEVPMKIWIKNSKINFSEHLKHTSNIYIEQFHLHLRILMPILKCNSKEEADFIFEYYKKDKTIKNLYKEIFNLKHELKSKLVN